MLDRKLFVKLTVHIVMGEGYQGTKKQKAKKPDTFLASRCWF